MALPRNPFLYPAGTMPGINATMLDRNTFLFSCVALHSGNFINLAAGGARGSIVGTAPATVIHPVIGPALSQFTGNSYVQFQPGHSSIDNYTIAMICNVSSYNGGTR